MFTVEVISIILAKVPVKPLLSFRTVAKSWCSLIDSPAFVKMHLKQSILNLMILGKDCTVRSTELRSLDSAGVDSIDASKFDDLAPSFMDDILMGSFSSCNGLVHMFKRTSENRYNYIWNPSTRKCWDLPPISFDHESFPPELSNLPYYPDDNEYRTFDTHGFAYVSETDEYKVVLVIQICGPVRYGYFSNHAYMFSSVSNQWERLEPFPHQIQSKFVHSNGVLHYLVEKDDDSDDSEWELWSFDTKTKQHSSLPKPVASHMNNVRLDVLDEKPCLLHRQMITSEDEDRTDIWVMKGSGIEASWDKKLSVDVDLDGVRLLYTTYSEVILTDDNDRKLTWYNLSGERVREVEVTVMKFNLVCKSFYVRVWPESLVSFPGLIIVDDEKAKSQGSDGKSKKQFNENLKQLLDKTDSYLTEKMLKDEGNTSSTEGHSYQRDSN